MLTAGAALFSDAHINVCVQRVGFRFWLDLIVAVGTRCVGIGAPRRTRKRGRQKGLHRALVGSRCCASGALCGGTSLLKERHLKHAQRFITWSGTKMSTTIYSRVST